MLFVAAAVLLAPRVTESSLTGPVRKLLVGGIAVAATVLAVLSIVTMVADVRLDTALAARDAAAIARAAGTAPWHVQARYEAARTAADDALAAFTQGDPQAEAKGTLAEQLIRDLVAANPHEYASQLLLAYYTGQSGAILRSSDPAAASAAFQNSRLAAEAALKLKPLGADAALLKALAESSLGDNEAAIATLEPVWDIDPRFAEAGILYLKVLEQQGYDERAEQVLATLKVGFPSNAAIQEELRSREASAPAQ